MCARLDHFDGIGKGKVEAGQNSTPSRGKMRSRSTQMTRGWPLAFRQVARSAIRLASARGATVKNVVSLQHCARAVNCTSDGDVVPFVIAARKRDLRTFDGDFKTDVFQAVGTEGRGAYKVSV